MKGVLLGAVLLIAVGACGASSAPAGVGAVAGAGGSGGSGVSAAGSGGSGGAGGACVPDTCDQIPGCTAQPGATFDLGCGVKTECPESCGDESEHLRLCDSVNNTCVCYGDTDPADASLCAANEHPHFCGNMVQLGKVSNCHDIGVQRPRPKMPTEMIDVWCCDYF